MTKQKKVFLGGTCNNTTWRNTIISELDKLHINYFNPVVEDWTEECKEREEQEKTLCLYHLYVITPKMTGVFSIAEAVESVHTNDTLTIFCVLKEDENIKFDEFQLNSLNEVGKLILKHGGIVCHTLDGVNSILKHMCM